MSQIRALSVFECCLFVLQKGKAIKEVESSEESDVADELKQDYVDDDGCMR